MKCIGITFNKSVLYQWLKEFIIVLAKFVIIQYKIWLIRPFHMFSLLVHIQENINFISFYFTYIIDNLF